MSYRSILNKPFEYYKTKHESIYEYIKYLFDDENMIMIITDYLVHTYIIVQDKYGFTVMLNYINSIIQACISNIFNHVENHILSTRHNFFKDIDNNHHVYNIGCICSRFVYISNQDPYYTDHKYVNCVFYHENIDRSIMKSYESALNNYGYIKKCV